MYYCCGVCVHWHCRRPHDDDAITPVLDACVHFLVLFSVVTSPAKTAAHLQCPGSSTKPFSSSCSAHRGVPNFLCSHRHAFSGPFSLDNPLWSLLCLQLVLTTTPHVPHHNHAPTCGEQSVLPRSGTREGREGTRSRQDPQPRQVQAGSPLHAR